MPRFPAFYDILYDVFNLLLFLQSHDVKLRGELFLPPTSLHHLDPLMLPLSDAIIPSLRHDLPTQRVRFALFLAHSAGLVGATSSPRGVLIKPSAAASSWIHASMSIRAAFLVQAFLSDTTSSALIWSRLRLPGWRVIKAGLAQSRQFRFGDVLSALLYPQNPQNTLSQNILAVLPIVIEPRIKDADARTTTLLHAVLIALCWFGVIHPSDLTLTRSASTLLRKPVKPKSTAVDSAISPLSLVLDRPHHQALRGLQLVESKPAAWPLLYDLARIMLLTVSRPRSFTLNHELVLHAYDTGLSVNALQLLLERAIGDAVPHAVSLLLHRWLSVHEQWQLRPAILLQANSPDLLDQLMQRKAFQRELRRLSPNTAELRSGKVDALSRRLKRLGFFAHCRLLNEAPRPLLDGLKPADWAMIYQALELNQHIADFAPHLISSEGLVSGAPAPYALIQTVAARLEPALVEAIHVGIAELIQRSQSRLRESAAARPADDKSSPIIRKQLEQAISTGATMRLTYHAAGSDEVTLRDVQPRRIEWRGAVPYLIAWCNLRQDERTFRIDRIMTLESVMTLESFMALEDAKPDDPTLP